MLRLQTTGRRRLTPWALIACLLLATSAHAQLPAPAAPQVPARSFVLVDFDSGETVASKAEALRVHPASITKLMTAYVVFRELAAGRVRLDQPVRVSEKAWRTGGSRMFIEVDTEVPVEALLQGMIVQSGNDASVALAELVAGDEATFAEVMNQHARRLGMVDTNFRNSTGLPMDNHYSSARDIALLAVAIIREFPEYYRWYSQKEYTWNDIKQKNRNTLLW